MGWKTVTNISDKGKLAKISTRKLLNELKERKKNIGIISSIYSDY